MTSDKTKYRGLHFEMQSKKSRTHWNFIIIHRIQSDLGATSKDIASPFPDTVGRTDIHTEFKFVKATPISLIFKILWTSV